MSLSDLEEWRRLLGSATRPSVKTQIQLIISNLESSVPASTATKNETKVVYNTINTFSWDQTSKSVTVLIPVAEEVKDVTVDVDGQSLDVKFSLGGKYYQLYLKKLYSTVNKEGLTWKCKSGFLQVKIQKVRTTFLILLGQGVYLDQFNLVPRKGTATLKINFKDKKMPAPKTEDSNPQAMLMDLMKNMYNEGDDDMKRTIAKAWTEAMGNKGGLKF